MAKLESNLRNMLLSLTLIASFASMALAGVYIATKDAIEEAKKKEKQEALLQVLPPFETLQESKVGADSVPAYLALDADGKVLGTAVETSENGFNGVVKVLVGFDNDDKIINYVVLEQTETPGLGTHMVQWFKNAEKPKQNIVGRTATGNFTVSKDGGDVDAITAATISSRAFLKAVNAAYDALKQINKQDNEEAKQ